MPVYVTQSIKRAAQVNPQGVATICGTRRRSWRDVLDRVRRIADALARLGIAAGEPVGILANNSDAYLELQFALPWLNAVIVPLNTRLAPAEIDYMLGDAGIRCLFVDAASTPLLDQCSHDFEHIIGLDDGCPKDYLSYERLIDDHQGIDDAATGGDTLAGIFYTGGNTGLAKGVMLSHLNLCTNAMNCIPMVGYQADSVYLHAAPMFHLSDGMVNYALTMLGGTHVFLPKFDATACLDLIQTHRVTNIALVPTMVELLVRLAEHQPYDLTCLRQIQFGASPMPDGTLQRAIKLWPDMLFLHGWGMTELSPIGSMLPHALRNPAVAGSRLRSCGTVAYNMEIEIVDAEDQPLAPGNIGEIAVRGPAVMQGYLNKPAETAAALRNGWLHTGDAAYMDDEGLIFIVDRLKDMIISGGENVYSTEVENAISRLPGVAQVAVIGIPHPVWGEAVHAIVVPEAGTTLTEDAIMEGCRATIARYKCPRSVALSLDPLPLTGAGKINKRALRAGAANIMHPTV